MKKILVLFCLILGLFLSFQSINTNASVKNFTDVKGTKDDKAFVNECKHFGLNCTRDFKNWTSIASTTNRLNMYLCNRGEQGVIVWSYIPPNANSTYENGEAFIEYYDYTASKPDAKYYNRELIKMESMYKYGIDAYYDNDCSKFLLDGVKLNISFYDKDSNLITSDSIEIENTGYVTESFDNYDDNSFYEINKKEIVAMKQYSYNQIISWMRTAYGVNKNNQSQVYNGHHYYNTYFKIKRNKAPKLSLNIDVKNYFFGKLTTAEAKKHAKYMRSKKFGYLFEETSDTMYFCPCTNYPKTEKIIMTATADSPDKSYSVYLYHVED